MDGPTVKLKLLESALVGIPVNTESKALTRKLNPLDSVFTKIWGGVQSTLLTFRAIRSASLADEGRKRNSEVS